MTSLLKRARTRCACVHARARWDRGVGRAGGGGGGGRRGCRLGDTEARQGMMRRGESRQWGYRLCRCVCMSHLRSPLCCNFHMTATWLCTHPLLYARWLSTHPLLQASWLHTHPLLQASWLRTHPYSRLCHAMARCLGGVCEVACNRASSVSVHD